MFRAQRARVATEASHHDLGAPDRVYRSRRTVPIRTVWLVTGVAAGSASLLFATGHGLLGSLVLPQALLGLLAYVYLLPPVGGRRWVALYAHGLVEVSSNFWQQPQAARWESVRSVVHEARPVPHTVVTFAPARADAPVVVTTVAFDRRYELAAAIDRHTGPVLLARAAGPLAEDGAVTGPAVAPPHEDRLRFRRAVAALAALAVIPGAGYSAYAAVTGPAEPAQSTSPEPDRQDSWNPTLGPPGTPPPVAPEPTPAPAPPPPLPPLPTSIYGFDDLCEPKPVAYPGAARYAGPGPHPVWFEEDVAYVFEDDLPARWKTKNVRKVQLVTCVDDAATGPVVRRCSYESTGGTVFTVRMRQKYYTVRLYEARTARRLMSMRVRGSDTHCPEFIFRPKGALKNDLMGELTARDIQRAIGRYVW